MRVLILDDDVALLEVLQPYLERHHMVSDVKVASTIAQAERVMAGNEINLLIVDERLKEGEEVASGSDFIEKARASNPSAWFLLLTADCSWAAAERAFEKGADGFLSKLWWPGEITKAIERVASGEGYLDPKMLPELLRSMRARAGRVRDPARDSLTAAEVDVVGGMVRKESNEEIARRRGSRVLTVKSQVKVIFEKLEVDGREAAVVEARRRGII